ncbi:hypothetical protein SAMN05444398_11287 [Roseovarius pacificus]|uniref:Integron cassette protein VCH-CASS1 chain domain-containing protein n=1 Tax=Roseovarius pacificus TaxID=337701 RepID=A0A1M7HCS1_9RHOB|nr:hypothetical protein [Roseovarius pacificus]GGO58325.1 hypothetical protein GCM10011315_27620 [Roseovarius pacificus]SHM26229.1 hypothetical protein SAMN05444398_11287 [Roseovarius pacificus]
MARNLSTDADIDAYIAKVIQEAHHHAQWVAQIIQPLSDEVRNKLNLSPDTVEVYERNGNLARTCWVTLSGNRYVFTYDYGGRKIDLKERTLRGRLIHSFDNNTPTATIAAVVAQL